MKEKEFEPPTLEDVTSYAMRLGYTDFNSARFLNYHQGKGWSRVRKSWRAAVVAWQRNSPRYEKKGTIPENRSGLFQHPPGWEPTPDAELAKQGVDLEALKRARDQEKA